MIVNNDSIVRKVMTPANELFFIPNELEVQQRQLFSNDYDFDYMPIDKTNNMIWFNKKENRTFQLQYSQTISIESDFNNLLLRMQFCDVLFVAEDQTIAGIITLSDMNKKIVLLFLYSKIVDLEIALSKFIQKNKKEEDILEILKIRCEKRRYADICGRYKNDKENNISRNICEYLYLDDFGKILSYDDLIDSFGIEKEMHGKMFLKIKGLRNCIMHPTKSMVSNKKDIENMLNNYSLINEYLFYLYGKI